MKRYKRNINSKRKSRSSPEKVFEMSFSALVKGNNAEGEQFAEQALLKNISSETAVFSLEHKVLVGSKLHLMIDIPKTFILKKQLNLLVSGEVEKTHRGSGNEKEQIVELTLSPSFEINEGDKESSVLEKQQI